MSRSLYKNKRNCPRKCNPLWREPGVLRYIPGGKGAERNSQTSMRNYGGRQVVRQVCIIEKKNNWEKRLWNHGKEVTYSLRLKTRSEIVHVGELELSPMDTAKNELR